MCRRYTATADIPARRAFVHKPRLALLLCAAVAMAAPACTGGLDALPTPTPQVVRVAPFEGGTEGEMLTAARGVLEPRGMRVELLRSAAADIHVTSVPSGEESTPFVTSYWVPVVTPSHPITTISLDELKAAFTSETNPWSATTGTVGPLLTVLPNDRSVPFEQWWPGELRTASRMDVPTEGVWTVLSGQLDAIALMPLDAVDSHVKVLTVDGVNPVFGEGDIGAYPLVERAWVTPQTTAGVSDELNDALAEAARAIAAELNVGPPDPIVLRATGDILPVRCALERMQQLGDLSSAFRELGPWLAEADITVGSLDAAISDAGTPFGCEETFSLLGPAATADGFALAGIDVMTVATNHTFDCGIASCGEQAFLDTLANLRSRGIQPVGGGTNLAEARRPAILTVKGVRFAFLGYDEILPANHATVDSSGTAPLDEATLREDVAEAAQQADVVIVEPQWGIEYTADPNERQRALARAAVEAGADLIIGNHPHWVEAAETIDDTFVAYALGNFVFDQDWSLETQQGVVLEAAFHGDRLAGVRFVPVHIYDEHQPRFAEPAEAQQILDRIWDASERLAPLD
jgi:poly-gamma-glutamate synthesis protein (capsule biosynthesis protein)